MWIRNYEALKYGVATGIENVPIFIKADNAEKEVEKYLARHE